EQKGEQPRRDKDIAQHKAPALSPGGRAGGHCPLSPQRPGSHDYRVLQYSSIKTCASSAASFNACSGVLSPNMAACTAWSTMSRTRVWMGRMLTETSRSSDSSTRSHLGLTS